MYTVLDAIAGLSRMASEQNVGEAPLNSDEDLTKQFLLQNKVSEYCATVSPMFTVVALGPVTC